MPSCIAPCDINYCNAVASNPRLFLLLGNARYDGMHEVRALVNNAYACKHRNALYRIVAVLHAWGRCTHKRACMLRIRRQMHAKNVKNVMDFSLFSRNTLPPTKYRNPKTEHRIEIYLNISDYM